MLLMKDELNRSENDIADLQVDMQEMMGLEQRYRQLFGYVQQLDAQMAHNARPEAMQMLHFKKQQLMQGAQMLKMSQRQILARNMNIAVRQQENAVARALRQRIVGDAIARGDWTGGPLMGEGPHTFQGRTFPVNLLGLPGPTQLTNSWSFGPGGLQSEAQVAHEMATDMRDREWQHHMQDRERAHAIQERIRMQQLMQQLHDRGQI